VADADRRLLFILAYLLLGAGYAVFLGMSEPWFERSLAAYRENPELRTGVLLSGALVVLIALWPFWAAIRIVRGKEGRRR